MSLREPDPYPQPGDDVPGAPPPLRGTPAPAPATSASPVVPAATRSYGGRIAAGAAAALAVLAVVAVVRRFRRRRG
ncbi:MAG TPA: hypothetical protein VGL93_36425 [Streptosporangiaceae bacterium]